MTSVACRMLFCAQEADVHHIRWCIVIICVSDPVDTEFCPSVETDQTTTLPDGHLLPLQSENKKGDCCQDSENVLKQEIRW